VKDVLVAVNHLVGAHEDFRANGRHAVFRDLLGRDDGEAVDRLRALADHPEAGADGTALGSLRTMPAAKRNPTTCQYH
jgi:hypothetical protein